MLKKSQAQSEQKDEKAFEMIELAVEDINVLARAFNLIQKVCDGEDAPAIEIPSGIPERLLN